ncbi:hypothetical protein [Chitinilyticum piscinae]|uniref:C2H2-type domain-containing protein n=1 Tax=Chitinilyticum piscinae TaxID=2866724 RepID=A0A8J7KB48_9NEIS|nr:hypothetical protein [Chitinilyticum piscinae]MBE9609844.1 hypothetical protein [Chitinilyticum piscinae]
MGKVIPFPRRPNRLQRWWRSLRASRQPAAIPIRTVPCPRCGAAIPLASERCLHCGVHFAEPLADSTTEERPAWFRLVIWALIIGLVLPALGAVLFWLALF